MELFGMKIGEVAALVGIVGSFFGGVMWLFKVVIINPLSVEIQSLNKGIERLADQIKDHENDRRKLQDEFESLKIEVNRKSAEYEEKFKSIFSRLGG